jgi:hypothetical protein
MWKAALAGALALAAVGVLPASAQEFGHAGSAAHSGAAMSEAQIAQAKAALRLTPSQERHWPRVAAALRALSRMRASGDDGDNGFVQRMRGRAAAVASQAAGARRVMAAAMPLVRTLNAEQKETAAGLVRAAGFGHLASRF